MTIKNRLILVINVVGTIFIWGIYCIEVTLFAVFNIIIPTSITGTWMTYKWLYLSQQPILVSATAILTGLVSIIIGYFIMCMVASWIRRGS